MEHKVYSNLRKAALLLELIYNSKLWKHNMASWKLEEEAHHVVVTAFADEGYSGIAWDIGAAVTHQITKGLGEEGGGKHT